jgi:hypothetical protein
LITERCGYERECAACGKCRRLNRMQLNHLFDPSV